MTNSLTKTSSATSAKVAMFLLGPFIPKLPLPITRRAEFGKRKTESGNPNFKKHSSKFSQIKKIKSSVQNLIKENSEFTKQYQKAELLNENRNCEI